MARAVPGLRRLEHARRGGRSRGGRRRPRAARARRRRRAQRAAAAARGRRRAGEAPSDRHRRARPRARRRARARLAVLLGGSPGIGKSTLTNMALGHLAGRGHSTLYVSGEESAEQVRLRAERLCRRRRALRRCRSIAETDARGRARRRSTRERPEVCVIDSVQTLHARELSGAPGSVGQVREVAARDHARSPRRSGIRGDPRRPRDQGGRAGGPARARAPRRLRAAVRGRARAHLPRAARAEEPLRLDQRGRACSRCARAGWSRCSTPRRASSPRRRARPAASCWRRWRARGRCSSRCRRSVAAPSWSRRAGSSRASTATASRSCSPILARHGGVGIGGARRVRQRRRRRARRRAGRRPGGRAGGRERGARRRSSRAASDASAPLACFGELGLTGELRWVAHPERRVDEAAQVRPRALIAPPDSDAGRARRDLREALALALPGGEAPDRGLQGSDGPPVRRGVSRAL